MRKYYITDYGLNQVETYPQSITLRDWILATLADFEMGMNLRELASYMGYGNRQGQVKQALEELMDEELVVYEDERR